MFTLQQIADAHEAVKTGADFPGYIKALKELGVQSFHTYVSDSHTEYFGSNDFQLQSEGIYEPKSIADQCNATVFLEQLKKHQQGKTDYFQFCEDCASNGIEKWIMDLRAMTCTYYDKTGNAILEENIPSL